MSTISSTIANGIVITGYGAYTSPLTVATAGFVTNGSQRDAIFGGAATVINDGTISTTGANYSAAVYLSGISVVDNHNRISGSINAIAIGAGGTVSNSGTVTAGRWGISARQLATITNSGSIYGASNGINVVAAADVTNTGAISGSNGVGIDLGAGTVTNSGSITATFGTGIRLGLGGTIVNTASGQVTAAGYSAIYVLGAASSISNFGVLSGVVGVQFDAAGTFAQTLTNGGTIIGSGGTAVAFGAGDDVMTLIPGALALAGVVDGGGGANRLEFASAATIGTLSGGASFLGFATGTVAAGAQWVLGSGVTIGAGTTLRETGALTATGSLTIAGRIDVDNGLGLVLAPGSYLLNTATGIVDRVGPAIVSFSGYGQVITGLASGAVSVTNLGTIANALAVAGIRLLGGGTVVNGSTAAQAARIDAGNGVHIAGGLGQVSNFGTITGSGIGIGVVLNAGGTVSNGSPQSVISTLGYGILGVNGTVTVVNFGTVAGQFGIDLRAGGTVINAGTVTGAPGSAAIRFGAGNDLLVLQPGYAITGAITAAGTGNVMQLQGSLATPLVANFTSLNPVGFGTVDFAPSAFATLAISNTANLPGTITGFTGLNQTIDLPGLNDAGNDAFANFDTLTSRLTVSGSGGTVTLQLGGNLAGIGFVAGNDGAGGTAVHPVALGSPIFTGFTNFQGVPDQAASAPFADTIPRLTENPRPPLRNGGNPILPPA